MEWLVDLSDLRTGIESVSPRIQRWDLQSVQLYLQLAIAERLESIDSELGTIAMAQVNR